MRVFSSDPVGRAPRAVSESSRAGNARRTPRSTRASTVGSASRCPMGRRARTPGPSAAMTTTPSSCSGTTRTLRPGSMSWRSGKAIPSGRGRSSRSSVSALRSCAAHRVATTWRASPTMATSLRSAGRRRPRVSFSHRLALSPESLPGRRPERWYWASSRTPAPVPWPVASDSFRAGDAKPVRSQRASTEAIRSRLPTGRLGGIRSSSAGTSTMAMHCNGTTGSSERGRTSWNSSTTVSVLHRSTSRW